MKPFWLLLFLQLIVSSIYSQEQAVDSLNKRLLTAKEDTSKVLLLAALIHTYVYSHPDSAIFLAQQGYDLAQRLNFAKGQSFCLTRMAVPMLLLGNFPR